MSENEKLKIETERQGREYSRKVLEEYDTFWGDSHWDYVRAFRCKWMIDGILDQEPGHAPLRLLDAGCGIGFTALACAANQSVGSVTAIDAAAEALKVAEKLKADSQAASAAKVEFQNMSFFDVPDDAEFDCVYMHEVIEHVASVDAVFDKALRVVRPRGYFMVSTPNRDRMLNRLMKAAGRPPVLIDPYHLKEFTLAELTAARTGWHVVATSGRQLIDEAAMAALLSLGINPLQRITASFARKICRSMPLYHAGALLPAASSELLVLYRKEK